MQKKKLIVHIGANKTGSSAIQRFLAINGKALLESGVVVPDQDLRVSGKTPGFHVFAFQELLNSPNGREQLEAAIDAIAAEQPNADAILVSAENLAANPAAPSLFAGLVERYDVQVILYIRRQDEYLLSSWQQWYSKVLTDFWAWIVSVSGTLGNWRTCIESWEGVVPREQITVRIFQRKKLDGGDAILDFYNRLGLATPFAQMSYPKTVVNPSFSYAVMDLVKGNKLIFENPNDNEFYNFVQAMTKDKYVKNSRQSLITFAQRRAILGKYPESNLWVRERYFPGAPGLFLPPQESDYDVLGPDAMQAEKMEFLTTMLYQMHKQGKSQ